MTTGASDSLGIKQAANSQPKATALVRTINKQTVIIVIALLAVLSLVIFRLTAHANSQDDTPSANANTTVSEASKPSSNTTVDQSSNSTSGNSSSVNIKLNSTSSSSSAGNSSSNELTVNGERIPSNGGNLHYSSSDGNVHVNVSSSNHSNSGGDAD